MERFENMENKRFTVPENELKISFGRGGGPGGQNVNKVETKAIIRWNLNESAALTDEQKTLIAEKLKNRVNRRGELAVDSQEQRSQTQNKEQAIEILNELVNRALTVEAERIPTKIPRSAKEKRLEEKRKQGEKRAGRKPIDYSSERE